MSRELWLKRMRNYAGLLGALLPWISLLGAVLVNARIDLGTGFWSDLSISATYYITPALAGILTTASVVLMCYDGYDKWDSLITTISGVFGICIVLFPCNCSIATEYTGFFQLPVKVSSIFHCTSAVIFFCLLAYNSMFLFTKTHGNVTKEKKLRNKIYFACAVGMLSAMVLMPLPVSFPMKTWWVEMISLTFFGISWLVKGGAFKFLNDKE